MGMRRNDVGGKVLVIGKSAKVQENLVHELAEYDIRADTTTNFESAGETYDPHDYDLIVYGSGIVGPISEGLRRKFRARDASVRFLDAFGPVAAREIRSNLGAENASSAVTRFELMGESDTVAFDLARETRVIVHGFDGPPEPIPTTWIDDQLPPGSHQFTIPVEQRQDLFAVTITVDNDEIHHLKVPA